MDFEELSLKAKSLMRRAGLNEVSRPALVGAGAIGVLLLCISIWHFWPHSGNTFVVSTSGASASSSASNDAQTSQGAPSSIVVDVEGSVVSPGLYSLEADSRVGDAVNAAGGLAADASPGAVNLAQKLTDGEQVRIPSIDDAGAQDQENQGVTESAGIASSKDQGKININTASAEELQKLSGIGPSLSERIIDYRESNGRFSSIEDLRNVSGIGETRFSNLKDKICI